MNTVNRNPPSSEGGKGNWNFYKQNFLQNKIFRYKRSFHNERSLDKPLIEVILEDNCSLQTLTFVWCLQKRNKNNNKPLLKWYRDREELHWLSRWIYAPKITSSIHLWFITLCFLAIHFMSIATLYPLGKMSTRVVSCYWTWCHWIAGFLWRRFGTWRVSFKK